MSKLLIIMKKIVLIPILTFLMLFAFTSCDESDDTQIYTGNEIAYFDTTASTLLVTIDNPSTSIDVVTTVVSSAARTFNVSIDPASTSIEGVDYTLVSNSITIPAGEYSGSLTVNGIFDGALETGSKLILNLTGEAIAEFDTIFTLDIFKLCESDLSGMYEVTTTYGYHDFLPDYNPNVMMMEVVDVDGAGTYSVFDFSGGLYSSGPYASAYGTGGADNTLTFTDICGGMNWTGQTDPWGDILLADGGVNSVDASGVITISWFCTGYGENGVSVYVPQ